MVTTAYRRRQLLAAYTEQNGECFYCDKPTWLPWSDTPGPDGLMATREHLIRRCDGGSDNDNNIAMACAHCNNRRHDIEPAEWIARRGGEMPDGCVQFGLHKTNQTPDFTPDAEISRPWRLTKAEKGCARRRYTPDRQVVEEAMRAVAILDAHAAERKAPKRKSLMER